MNLSPFDRLWLVGLIVVSRVCSTTALLSYALGIVLTIGLRSLVNERARRKAKAAASLFVVLLDTARDKDGKLKLSTLSFETRMSMDRCWQVMTEQTRATIEKVYGPWHVLGDN